MDNRKRRSTEYNRISSASSKNGPFPIAFLPNNFLLEFLEHSTWRASITRDHPCISLCTFPKSSSFPSNRHASHSNVEWRGELVESFDSSFPLFLQIVRAYVLLKPFGRITRIFERKTELVRWARFRETKNFTHVSSSEGTRSLDKLKRNSTKTGCIGMLW